ncbi:MAG: hypothetical protein ACLUVM_10705 [Blautia faecis]
MRKNTQKSVGARVIEINQTKEYEELAIEPYGRACSRAYIKVQDGCNQFCTYCIIPYARGRVQLDENRGDPGGSAQGSGGKARLQGEWCLRAFT